MAKTECKMCGKFKVINASNLYNKKFISCVCRAKTHGMSKSRLYRIFHHMKDRCLNPKNHAYKDYGQKGVKIFEDWLNDYMTFYEWAISNGYKENLTIDRIDVNGSYEPENCQWITLSENVALANKTNVRRHANKGTYFGINPDGVYYEFDNANEFGRKHNLNGANIRDVANKRKKTHRKWKFGFVIEKTNK